MQIETKIRHFFSDIRQRGNQNNKNRTEIKIKVTRFLSDTQQKSN